MMIQPLVSIRLMVFNNESYIREAIEGILIQKTNFKVEIVVGDDFSSDKTLDIIKSYDDTENIYFNFLHREVGGQYWTDRQKLGRLQNFRDIIDNCSGKYVALLDGDDYWTDSLKLQKQVDFLESKPKISVCFTGIEVLKGLEFTPHQISPEFIENEFPYYKLLQHNNFITTVSVVFRKPNNFNVPNWFLKLPYGDMGLYKLLSNYGNFYGLRDITSVYRVHDKGIYSGLNILSARLNYLNFYKKIFNNLNSEERKVVKIKIEEKYREISRLKFKNSPFLRVLFYVYLRIINLGKY